MSKLMTLYVLFDRLKTGILDLQDTFLVSKKAWRKGGSKMFVRHNDRISVEDLIRGIVIQSGNDACIVVAEGLEGTEAEFVKVMNKTAKKIGLTHSHFVNATGWPDEGHVMSAKDLALLAQRLMEDFPEYYGYFSEKEFTYSKIRQFNRNTLLWRSLGVDGLKTGHTDAGGYGITITAKSGDRRLVLVVNGLKNEKERENEAERLIKYGFRGFDNVTLFKANQEIERAEIWFGREQTVPLVAKEDIYLTLPSRGRDDMQLSVQYNGPIPAPITKGQSVAELHVSIPGREDVIVPLYAAKEIEKLTGLRHIIRSGLYYITNRKFTNG